MITGGGAGEPGAAGGPARHIPVLVHQVVEQLNVRDNTLIIDGTFGAGGYTREILSAANCNVIGIDRDQTAITAGYGLVEAMNGRLTLVEDTFSALGEVVGEAQADGVVLDLGVSSMQLDTAERGFSFRLDGPLDMRMGQDGPTAADVVAHANERDLANVIFLLGEERHSRGVARAIVKARGEQPITTTRALADIVSRVVRGKPGEIHPATRTFQALRLFVNDELGELARALAAAEHALKPGGRLVVVSFHSLEDRIVKTFFAERAGVRAGSRHLPETQSAPATFTTLTKKPIVADNTEISANPRSRSAKLRAGERIAAPATEGVAKPFPNLPSLDEILRSDRR
jgi:16S rRNA (cytosine1402-N4)-methyltransferase